MRCARSATSACNGQGTTGITQRESGGGKVVTVLTGLYRRPSCAANTAEYRCDELWEVAELGLFILRTKYELLVINMVTVTAM